MYVPIAACWSRGDHKAVFLRVKHLETQKELLACFTLGNLICEVIAYTSPERKKDIKRDFQKMTQGFVDSVVQ